MEAPGPKPNGPPVTPAAGSGAPATGDAALAGLLGRMAAGDETALGAVYDATLGKVYGLALRITRSAETAEDETTRSYLLRMAPGTRLPAHDHDMDEECTVLEGEVQLGDIFARAGDYHLGRSGLPHGEVHTDGGCLLFLRGQKHYQLTPGG